MKKKMLSGIMAALMMLSVGSGCSDTLDSSTLAEYDKDSKHMAEIKEAQEQAQSAMDVLVKGNKTDQESSETNAEPSKEELNELGKTVEKNAYAFYCDTVVDGVRFPSDQPLPIEIGKIDATEEHIKKMQENIAKEASDKYKGYVVTIAINRKDSELLVYVSISKKVGSEPLYTNITPEEYI